MITYPFFHFAAFFICVGRIEDSTRRVGLIVAGRHGVSKKAANYELPRLPGSSGRQNGWTSRSRITWVAPARGCRVGAEPEREELVP
jgi:hypothetical protein